MMYAPRRGGDRERGASWTSGDPNVQGASSLEEAGLELFTFLSLRQAMEELRTTNAIERLNEEFQERVKVKDTASAESVCMLFWALLSSGRSS